MKADDISVNDFLESPKRQFIIPVYQRNYDWSTSQCKQLLDDIIQAENESWDSHFIGSIVYINDSITTTKEVKQLVIIDGQQRLTTLIIIYVALFRYAVTNNEDIAEELKNLYLINQYAKIDLNKLKLKQTDINFKAINVILKSEEDSFLDYSNVIENFNFFNSLINEDNFDKIIKGLKRLSCVEIRLERGKDDPQRIFESLNSTGLALTQSDLIRNFILMDLEPIRQEEVFDSIWNPIEKNAYNYQLQKSVVSDFIRNYLTLKNKKIPKKLGVFEEFKKRALTQSPEQFESELIEIKELSKYYNKIINPETIQDKEISAQIKYINRLEINVSYPFLMKLFEDLGKNIVSREDFLRLLTLVQSYSWRRFVVGLPTNALNKVFMSLASEIDELDYYNSIATALLKKSGSGLFPNDEEFISSIKEKNLYNIRPKNKSYMFEILENYQNKEHVDTNNSQVTIEHISPQNPDKDWLKEMENEEYIKFQNKYLNTIGNLTLSGNNGSLGNKSFKKKLEMNVKGGEQGYKFSRLWLNRNLKEYQSWNRENYIDRSKLLIERFLNIWSYPDIVLTETNKETEQNIFDCDPPTNKNLDYYIFLDEKKLVNSVTQMYIEVLTELFTMNPKLLIYQEYIIVNKDVNKFRAPQEIGNGYFIEKNIESAIKFKKLEALLDLFEMEDDLFIKYS